MKAYSRFIEVFVYSIFISLGLANSKYILIFQIHVKAFFFIAGPSKAKDIEVLYQR